MTDIFLSEDLRKLLYNKKVVFMGDSNIRALYKDVICLYAKSQLISQATLKQKMEKSVFNDKLVSHGEKTRARDYVENRVLKCGNHNFSFYFLTRVYNETVEEKLTDMMKDKEPDVLILNSCVWDLCRWGPKGVEEYQQNLIKLMKKLNEILSSNCLVIWLTTPPISQDIKGGILVVQLDYLKYSLRFHVMEANQYARKVVVDHGYDILDVHYHLRMQIQRRSPDGIHWCPETMRYITNLLLTHISLSWDAPLPHRYNSSITSRVIDVSDPENDELITLESEAATPAKPEKQPIQAPLPASGNKKKGKMKQTPIKKKPFQKNARRNQGNNSQRHRIQVWMHSPQHDIWQSQQQQQRPYQFPERANYNPNFFDYPMPTEERTVFQFSAPPAPPRQISLMDAYPYNNFAMNGSMINQTMMNNSIYQTEHNSLLGNPPMMNNSINRTEHNSLLGDPPMMRPVLNPYGF